MMQLNLLNLDALMFASFLLVNLLVGLWYGKGVKTMSDYAIGDRNFSTAALVATIVATFFTGSRFFLTATNTYSQGMPYIIATCSMCLHFLFIGLVLAPRMGEFLGTLSVAEVMGRLYGNKVRLITSISGILWNIGGISIQFKVFGSLVNDFIGGSPALGVIIAGTIVILYAAFGGIKAVTYTDILQFFAFGFIVPVIGIIIWQQFHELGHNFSDALANPVFSFETVLNLKGEKLLDFICLIIYFAFPSVGPVHMQRVLMSKSVKQARSSFIIASIIFLFVTLAVIWIPFLISCIDSSIEANKITNYIINNYTYTGLKGLIIICVAAMAMSSADSFINGSSVLFAHDLKEVINLKIKPLVLSKVFSLILGTFAIYMAIYTNDLLSMVLNIASVYMPVVTIPLLFSILGFRTTTKSVLIAMSSGVIMVAVWNIVGIKSAVVIPAMFVNAFFLFSSHYILKQEGGWVGVNDRKYLDELKHTRVRKIKKFISNIKNSNLIDFCKKTAPKDEMMYTWLGIYLIFFTLSTMYATNSERSGINKDVILAIYQIMMCTGVLTAMYPIWPPKIKYEAVMQVAWNIIIFYMLIFFSCFFVIINDFGLLQFATFTLNLVITAILIGWKASIIMIPIGLYFSLLFYEYLGLSAIQISKGSPEFIFMYTLMLVGSSLIIFLRPKERQYILAEEKNNHLSHRIKDSERERISALGLKSEFIRNVTHEYNAPLTGIISVVQSLKSSYKDLSESLRLQAIDTICESALRLANFDNNLTIISKLTKPNFKLLKQSFNLSELIEERVEVCRHLYETEEAKENEDREFILNIDQNISYNGDKHYLSKLIDNLIINAITYCKKGKITISLNKEWNKTILFCVQDTGIGIPPAELYDIFSEFTVSSKTKTPAGGRGIGLTLCKKVIEVHGGKIWAESDGVMGARFCVILTLQDKT